MWQYYMIVWNNCITFLAVKNILYMNVIACVYCILNIWIWMTEAKSTSGSWIYLYKVNTSTREKGTYYFDRLIAGKAMRIFYNFANLKWENTQCDWNVLYWLKCFILVIVKPLDIINFNFIYPQIWIDIQFSEMLVLSICKNSTLSKVNQYPS